MQAVALGLVLATLMGGTGCSIARTGSESPQVIGRFDDTIASTPDTRRIAIDLVSSLVQLDDYSPLATTVQIRPPVSAFGAALLEALVASGYGLQKVDEDQGRNHLSYQTTPIDSAAGSSVDYQMTLGTRVHVQRAYRDTNEGARPSSALRISGTEPQAIRFDESTYLGLSEDATAEVRKIRFESPNGEIVQRTSRKIPATALALARALPSDDEPSQSIERTRQFVRAQLRNQPLVLRPAVSFVATQQLTLRFPTASTNVLGDNNKQAVRTLASLHSPQGDRFVVTSCNPEQNARWHDTFDPDDDARAERVISELLVDGVKGENIRRQKCFAGSYGDSLPRNAVNVTLERLKRQTLL